MRSMRESPTAPVRRCFLPYSTRQLINCRRTDDRHIDCLSIGILLVARFSGKKGTEPVNPFGKLCVLAIFFHLPYTYSNMKILYPLLLTLVALMPLRSSAQEYLFEVDSNVAYVPLQNATLLTDFVWDDPNLLIPFDFPFVLFDSAYSQLYINGEIGLGGILTPDLLYEEADIFPLLIPYGEDLIDLGDFEAVPTAQSPISYLVEGDIVGSRILKVEWRNAGFFDSDDAQNTINFQMWLYEGSNLIEYRYGPNNIIDPAVYGNGPGPVVGLLGGINETEDTLLTPYLLVGDPLDPIVLTEVDITEDTIALNATIPAGTVYRFGTVLPTSTVELTEPSLAIYPNPTSGLVELRPRNTVAIRELLLIDTNGRTIGRYPPVRTLDLSALPNGIYTILARGDTATAQHRIIKQ